MQSFIKLHKPPIANPRKKKLVTKCPLTKKQQTNSLLTTQIHLHTTQIHRDDRNKRNTSSIKVQQPIQERSKPSIDKTSERHNSIYYGNHVFFLSHVTFELQALYIIIFTNISGYINKKFQSIFYIFAIFNMKNLNVCHRNFDVNKNHFNCKTFTTEILDINRIRYNSGEMAEITYPHFDQHYSNQHYSTSHNL